ncbi:glycerol-3-phosphate phosphatase-like [Condylostylus longicornis]|uniref:glycerol-3-phosphate phosphatase-like n=1 Tax=Condylostylus longicornis TaxID=2530218 RepID=UPI00244DDABC|nr:glycerol-3-phosphate phosphatase-like [Condylostylus longicornis]
MFKFFLGPGYYAEIVQKVSNKEPIVLGKPGKDLCYVIQDQLKIKDPKRTLMIGDTLDQDVAFGKLCGYQTLIVLTGDAKLEDFKKPENAENLPDYYANSMAEMKILFENLNKI